MYLFVKDKKHHSNFCLFFFRILKILLKELIEKSLQQDRNNSKILLRSNASIAEKMLSNWFAFLLYGYIKVNFKQKKYVFQITLCVFFFLVSNRNILVHLYIYYFNQ